MPDLSELLEFESYYEYQSLPGLYGKDAIAEYVRETRRRFALVAREFDDGLHTEWFVRSYLSLKLVLASTVLASSGGYAEAHNLQAALPYLSYYTMLNCSRAFILTVPDYLWKGDQSIELTHRNAINTTANYLRRLDRNADDRWGRLLRSSQAQREIFSYRFPGLGRSLIGANLVQLEQAIEFSRLLAELAELNTECLAEAVRKHQNNKEFRLLENDDSWRTMSYDASDEPLIDDDDRYRVGRFFHKLDRPRPLVEYATEGLVEDFFGAWSADESAGGYNPDDHWSLLLDVG